MDISTGSIEFMNESGQSTSSDDTDTMFSALLTSCTGGSNAETQRVCAVDVESRRREEGGVRNMNKLIGKEETMRALLKSIELSCDDFALNVLISVTESYVASAKGPVRTKRLRKLCRCDVSSHLIRTIRSRLRGNDRGVETQRTTERLAELLLGVAVKDPKLTLKLRVGGLMPSLCNNVLDRPTELPCLLRLLCRAVRSPRNAQLAGRQRGVVVRIVARLRESMVNQRGSREAEQEEERLTATSRLLEVAYFLSKNKKTRTQLTSEGAVRAVYDVLEQNLNNRYTNNRPLREEVALVAIAVLRFLANNKRAKEELVAMGTVEMCEKSIVSIAGERERSDVTEKLQDSLCALSLRCMPLQTFPLSPTEGFPLKMALPSNRRRSTSRNERVRGRERPQTTEKMIEEREEGSSDDENEDEEDDVFEVLHKGKDSEEQEMGNSEDEQQGDEQPITFTKQKVTDLKDQYDSAFLEYSSSRQSSSTVRTTVRPYEEELRECVKATSSVCSFVKIAYPELADPDIDLTMHPLQQTGGSLKELIVAEMARTRLRAPFERRVVYSLDELLEEQSTSGIPEKMLGNKDVERVGSLDTSVDHLIFESRFESGNLRRATQAGPNHYELILSPDINQHSEHYQWFYFEVSNNKANVPYTFEIINCLKTTSMYSQGMQPVLFSVSEAMAGRPGWVRAGQQVCYYRNLYTLGPETDENEKEEKGKKKERWWNRYFSSCKNLFSPQLVQKKERRSKKRKKRCFFSIRFTLTFRHKADVCYIAYHYPYTYSYMKTTLRSLLSLHSPRTLIRSDVIGLSIGGNEIRMITVTGEGTKEEVANREIIFFTARVHPGETNSSWMMHGVLRLLCSSTDPQICDIRSKFVFKIIPMLNPDGVINGSHRCSLAGVDLNRVWDRPNRYHHPEIFHAKGVIQYTIDILNKKPFCVVDFHGHSRKSNVFMFGNNPDESWRQSDRKKKNDMEWSLLPELLDQTAPAFSYKNCRFTIAKVKEPSARIALWRQFGLSRVYTMESTYCGFDCGKYQGMQIGTVELQEMGEKLVESMTQLKSMVEKSIIERRAGKTRRGSSVEDRQSAE